MASSRSRGPTYELSPGRYVVAVPGNREVEFEVGEDGLFTPSNDDQREAARAMNLAPKGS
jgi:hypothetical protein